MPEERFVYIHGVVGRGRGGHDTVYKALRDGLAAQGVALPDITDPRSVRTEWGWKAGTRTGSLAVAQEKLGDLVATAPAKEGFSINPMTAVWNKAASVVRPIVQYEWSDIAYYTSTEGRQRARHDVWGQMLDEIPQQDVDLTILCHSGGTLLAHDFLFWLFSGQRDTATPAAGGAALWGGARAHWRLRRLVTLGSPLTPLMVRDPDLADRIATEPRPWFELKAIGLDAPSHSGPSPLWLNVWDRHDLLSYPVVGLYPGNRVKDLYADHSDSVPDAHGAYWRSPKVHQILAAHWDD